MTWGMSRDSGRKPNNLAEIVCTQSESGGLSTDTNPPGSKLANTKLCQLCVIERTAAE